MRLERWREIRLEGLYPLETGIPCRLIELLFGHDYCISVRSI